MNADSGGVGYRSLGSRQHHARSYPISLGLPDSLFGCHTLFLLWGRFWEVTGFCINFWASLFHQLIPMDGAIDARYLYVVSVMMLAIHFIAIESAQLHVISVS
jgi:hypothetical protein